jgi:hypothetical protein
VIAAFGEDEHVRALWALASHVFSQAVVFHLGLVIAVDMLFQHAGNGISAG